MKALEWCALNEGGAAEGFQLALQGSLDRMYGGPRLWSSAATDCFVTKV